MEKATAMVIEFGSSLPTKPKFFVPWDGPYGVLEKTCDVHYKIPKTGSSNKWQIVHYKRLKPVKEQPNQRRIITRPSPGRRQPAGKAVEDLEETAILGLFSENTTRRLFRRNTENPRNNSRYKWMEEEDDFFQNLFEEQETTAAIRREANHEKQDVEEVQATDLTRLDEREREREHGRSQPGTLSPKSRANGPTRDNGSTKHYPG